MEFVIEKNAIEVGLAKLRNVWSDADVNPQLKYVLFDVKDAEAFMTASNMVITATVRVPLYEKSVRKGVFGLSGRELQDIIKVADTVVSINVDENNVATVKTKGYHWRLRGVQSFSFGEEKKVDGNAMEVSRDALAKALQVCGNFMSKEPSEFDKYGIHVGTSSAEATDARRIAVFRKPFGADFTIPAKMVDALKSILDHGASETVSIRASKALVEVIAGEDKVVFTQMESFVPLGNILSQLNTYAPKFEVDRESFLLAVKRCGVTGDDATTVKLTRKEDMLLLTAMQENNVLGEGSLRVTWRVPDANFNLVLNWHLLKDSVDSLEEEVIKFGTGVIKGKDFVRLEEDDKSFILLTIHA